MRRLIASVNITLDGFMAGPDGNLNWHFSYWTGQMCEMLSKTLTKADTILLGRNTYKALAAYWPQKANDLSMPREDIALSEMMNHYVKAVVSKTISEGSWQNTIFLDGPLKTEVQRLKKQPGDDIIILGSNQLISSLIGLDLIDKYEIWLHPVVIKEGKSLFPSLLNPLEFRLVELSPLSSGVVRIEYERKIIA